MGLPPVCSPLLPLAKWLLISDQLHWLIKISTSEDAKVHSRMRLWLCRILHRSPILEVEGVRWLLFNCTLNETSCTCNRSRYSESMNMTDRVIHFLDVELPFTVPSNDYPKIQHLGNWATSGQSTSPTQGAPEYSSLVPWLCGLLGGGRARRA